jgi:HlyD family secretion protein
MKITRSRAVALAITLVVALLLAWALMPKPVPVDLEEVDRGPLAVTVDEEGETRVRDRYLVSAPLAGKVLRITLEPGDPVVAGETVLATFQPGDPALLDVRARAEAEAQVRAAQAALGSARAERERFAAEHALAAAEAERVRRLAAGEIVSRERLDTAVTAERSAAEALAATGFAADSARHELERARASLLQAGGEAAGGAGPLTLRSPIDGVVLRRFRESEAMVVAGEPLLEIADPARLEIVSDLLSTDAVRVSPGDRALIEQWGGGDALHGVVRRVEPSGFTKVSALGVEEQRVNVIVDFEDPRAAWERLGDGYRVELAIVVWERSDALRVPTGALFRAPGGAWAVYAAEDGRIVRRVIEIGRRNDLHAEVVSGLEEGDRVAVHPSDAVAEGVEFVER